VSGEAREMAISSEPELSIEPVVGWRVWRLHRTPRGLELASVVFDHRWPPKEAFRARCEHHRTEAPQAACRCGIYAAASPKALATALGFGGSISVVGAIGMWGRLIEHEFGARAQVAYPARLRLVCGRCLAEGRGAVEPAVLEGVDQLEAVCRRHRGPTGPTTTAASEVQAELLSTYAVDLLPLERVADPLRVRGRRPPADPVEVAGRVVIVLIHIVGFAIQAVWILLWTLATLSVLLAVGSILLGAVLRMFGLGDAGVGDP
jgi:hypothetical protein